MQEDVAPKLYEKITAAFHNYIGADPLIKAIEKREQKGNATMEDAWTYTDRVCAHASKALRKVLTEENLPNGNLYWNISNRTIKPLVREVHNMILDMAESIQKAQDEKQKIGIKIRRPSFPEERLNQFLNKISAVEEVDTDGI